MNEVNVFWPRSPVPGNMGDVWTPFLLSKMGVFPVWRNPSYSPKLLATGSIIRFAQKGDVVWGSGLIDSGDPICRDSKYLCVRGPITGKRCGCSVYGDPGLLAPLFVPKVAVRAAAMTVIPHYVHAFRRELQGRASIYPITTNVEATVADISACRSVVSSSLHGIIFAHAYGIPAGWWSPDNSLTGDDIKFRDYAESVGIELVPAKRIEDVTFALPDPESIKQCQQNLESTVPLWNVH